MLFSCCLKHNSSDDDDHDNDLADNLIQHHQQPQTQIAAVPPTQEKDKPNHTQEKEKPNHTEPPNIDATPPPPHAANNHTIQKIRSYDSYSSLHRYEQEGDFEQPNPLLNPTKSLIKMPSHEQFQKTKRQSELWLQSGNKILYFVSQKDEEMVMTYKVSHHKVDSQLLDYVLKPHRFSSKFKNKPTDLSLCLVLSVQSLAKLKALVANIIPDHHMRPVFGLFKKENELKSSKNHYDTDFYIHDIITVGSNSLRLQAFERIIIVLNSEKEVGSIMGYCQKMTQQFQLQEISKISFVFPAFLTLSEINSVLSRINRKFLISEVLEKTINHLGFYVELFEHTTSFEQAIIVSSIDNLYKEDEKINKSFELKLELAIGLLMIEIDYNNAKLFSTLISSFLMDKTISEYLKFIEFLHKDKREFISKLEALKLFDALQLEEIQKSHKMEEKCVSATEKTITIKNRHKRKLGELFQEYHTTKTPVDHSQRKKEWDDDLRDYHITATITEKHPKQLQTNCNIFEVIDDSYVDKADLDILPDDDEIEFHQDD